VIRVQFNPGFGVIIGQDHPRRLLSAFIGKNAIPHALLFSGIDGVGKHTFALSFAMACNCLRRSFDDYMLSESDSLQNKSDGVDQQAPIRTPVLPCGECTPCRKIQSGNHPDVFQIAPAGPMIKISQIRSLCHTLSMKPYEALYRVVILSDAHKLNQEAGNALLKMLEEPPDRTILILITSQEVDLLPTILSRCQPIRFNPIAKKDLEILLEEKEGVSSTDAGILSIMADGSYTRAKHLIDVDWMTRRNTLIEALGLDQAGTKPSASVTELLALAENLSKDKAGLSDSLQLLIFWLRDLIIYKFQPGSINNRDKVEEIQQVAGQKDSKQFLKMLSAIETVEKQISTSFNARLMAENLLMTLSGYIPE